MKDLLFEHSPRSSNVRERRMPGRLPEILGAGVAYLALAIAITWPLVLHLGTRIPGGGTFYDPTGYYNDFSYFSTHGLTLFGTQVQTAIDAPFGRPILPAASLEQVVSYGPGVAISSIWDPAAGLSIVALVGLASSAGAMYGLVRWLRAGKIAAGWAGAALMLSPYLTYRVGFHVPLANLACFPLLIIAGIHWMERPGLRRAVWIALVLVFAWLTNPYFGFMCMVMAAVIGVVGLIRVWNTAGIRSSLARLAELLICVGCLVIAPLLVLLVSSGSAVTGTLTRSADQLSLYGANLSDYIWPSHDSQLMGWLFGSSWHGAPGGEATVFLGWSTIALGVAWVVIACRGWHGISSRMRLMTILAGPLVATLVLFSLSSPYAIGGVSVNTPSYVVWNVVPFLRAYARFGAPVMVVLLTVAALAVNHVVTRTTRRNGILLGLGLVAVSAIELPVALPISSAPPLVVNGPNSAPASQFAVWTWLSTQKPDGILMELPASSIQPLPFASFMDRIWMYGQTIHHWPIANGGLGEESVGNAFGRLVGDPRFPDSAVNLATAGVRVVVVNPWAYRESGMQPPNTRHPPTGYVLDRWYPDGTAVWRVTAHAAPGLAVFDAGFSRWPDGNSWELTQPSGTVALYTPHGGTFFLELSAVSLGGSGNVRLNFGGGQVSKFSVVPGASLPIWFEVHLKPGTTIADIQSLAPTDRGAGPAVLTQGWNFIPVNGSGT
jgi:hypothetical protein